MIVIRLAGWALVFVGVLLLGHDLFQILAGRGFHPANLGDFWNSVSRGGADDFRGWVDHAMGKTASSLLGAFLGLWAFLSFLLPGYIMTRIGLPRAIQLTYTNAKPAIDAARKTGKR